MSYVRWYSRFWFWVLVGEGWGCVGSLQTSFNFTRVANWLGSGNREFSGEVGVCEDFVECRLYNIPSGESEEG